MQKPSTIEDIDINLMGSLIKLSDMSRLNIGNGKRIKIFGKDERERASTNSPHLKSTSSRK